MFMIEDLTRYHKELFPLSNKCFSTASRYDHSRHLIWHPPRHPPPSVTCWSSGPPSPCLLVWVGHQANGSGPPEAPLSERALQHILHHHKVPHGVRLQRPGWWRPGETIARPLTHEEIADTSTPWPAMAVPAAPATSAAALVEDESFGSTEKSRKIHAEPVVRDGSLDMLDQVALRWCTQRCLCEVQWLRPPRTARQEDFCFTRRHDTPRRAHHASD